MPKILIVDTYYPDFLRSLPFDPQSTYEAQLQAVLDRKFGTADCYSRNLRALGWEAVDVIANHEKLQEMRPLCNQIAEYWPDVLFMQDLSVDWPDEYRPDVVAGQLSCPWPGDEQVKRFDLLFTSFPHYVERIEKLGVKAIYLPLAFEPSVLDGVEIKDRIHDCVFVGGVGAPSHWARGMETLHYVAEHIPTFKWWGYGADLLPEGPLKQKYQGRAWGREMYEIMLQSKIVLNRHGEVAEGFANNMRMFEATGCGALLVTEDAPNLPELFASDEVIDYDSPADAVYKIRYYLMNEGARSLRAWQGQSRTLRDHTYAQRMKVVSETLQAMMVHA